MDPWSLLAALLGYALSDRKIRKHATGPSRVGELTGVARCCFGTIWMHSEKFERDDEQAVAVVANRLTGPLRLRIPAPFDNDRRVPPVFTRWEKAVTLNVAAR